LRKNFGFIEVCAGGSSVTIDLNRSKRDVGIRFECPRNSLMSCIEHELFDDLLIGNYMRTTLFNVEALYPHFTPMSPSMPIMGAPRRCGNSGHIFVTILCGIQLRTR
jgi:hypothetical protein